MGSQPRQGHAGLGAWRGCWWVGLNTGRLSLPADPVSGCPGRLWALSGDTAACPGPRGNTINPGGDTAVSPGPARYVFLCSIALLVQASGSRPLPALSRALHPTWPLQAWLPSCPSLMVSSLSPPSRFPETTHQVTVCPLPLMLESCPPLTALARASVQSLLGSHKGLLRKWRPREGERLREVTQPCLPGHGASGHSGTGWGAGSAVH